LAGRWPTRDRVRGARRGRPSAAAPGADGGGDSARSDIPAHQRSDGSAAAPSTAASVWPPCGTRHCNTALGATPARTTSRSLSADTGAPAVRGADNALALNEDLVDRGMGPREGTCLPSGSSLGGELNSLLRGVARLPRPASAHHSTELRCDNRRPNPADAARRRGPTGHRPSGPVSNRRRQDDALIAWRGDASLTTGDATLLPLQHVLRYDGSSLETGFAE
jgi:hypothetical protein